MAFFRRSTVAVVCLLLPLGGARAASPDPLAEAEAAHARVDFAAVRTLAQAALQRGGYERARLLRIYYFLGLSNAAAGDEAASLEAWKRLLDLDPTTRVDQDLSPRLRSAIHEARGFWASRTDHLALELHFARGEGVLHLRVTDTLPMAREVVVRARVGATGPFVESRLGAAPLLAVPIAGSAAANHVEYMAELLDEHGNHLLERGSAFQPISEDFDAAARARLAATGERAAPAGRPGTRLGLIVAGSILEVLGVGALAGGVGAWFIASAAADRWNNDAVCLAGGRTREANCSSDRATAESAQAASIASLSVGGVLVVVSTAMLLLAPPAERAAPAPRLGGVQWHLAPGPGLGAAIGARF